MQDGFLEVGERIEKRLKALKRKQIELHDDTGISANAISNYINGKRLPDTTSLYKISIALGTSMEWLLTGAENTSNENEELSLSEDEQKLIKEIRLLSERDQEEVFWFARMKARRENMGNNHGSLTLKDGDGGMEGDDGSNATA